MHVCDELFFFFFLSSGSGEMCSRVPFHTVSGEISLAHLALESSRSPWLGEPRLWCQYSEWRPPLGGDGWTQRALPGGDAQAGGRQTDGEKRSLSVERTHLLFSGRAS